MAERKRGRVSADGAEIVARQVVTMSLDQVSKEVMDEFMEKADGNFGVAIRALCHAYKNAGGHCNPITAAPAAGAVPEIAGGHTKRNTRQRGGAAGAGVRVVKAAPVEGAVTREMARQAVIDQREKNTGGLLSDYTRDGVLKTLTKSMRDREAFARGERTAW